MSISQRLKEQTDALQKTIDTPTINVFERVMAQFPASPTNNGREIVKSKLTKMHNCPNDRTAKELDGFGFSVDHDDRIDHAGEWAESDFSNKS